MNLEQRNKWIEDNINFIYKVCAKFNYRFDYEDICQEAILGAIAALDKVNDGADEKMIRAYTSLYMEGYVKNNCIKKTSIVHIPRYAADQGVQVTCLSIEWEYESEETFESLYLGYNEPGYEEVEVMEDFRRCIKNLPEKVQKTALMIAEGYERKDVAEADGCSKQNINLRVDAIKRACRRLYA